MKKFKCSRTASLPDFLGTFVQPAQLLVSSLPQPATNLNTVISASPQAIDDSQITLSNNKINLVPIQVDSFKQFIDDSTVCRSPFNDHSAKLIKPEEV